MSSHRRVQRRPVERHGSGEAHRNSSPRPSRPSLESPRSSRDSVDSASVPTRAEPSSSAQGRYTLSSRQGNRARHGQATLIEEADETIGDDDSPFELPLTTTGHREQEMIRHTGLQPSVEPEHDASIVLQQQGNLTSLEKGFAALKIFDWKGCQRYILQHHNFLSAASKKHFLDEARDQLRKSNSANPHYRQCIQAATILQRHQQWGSNIQVLCRYLSELEKETATKNQQGPNLEAFLGSFNQLNGYVRSGNNEQSSRQTTMTPVAISRHAGGTASIITEDESAYNTQSTAATNQSLQTSHAALYEHPTGLENLAISEKDPQRITSMSESIKGKERADWTRNLDRTQPQGTPFVQSSSLKSTEGSAASGLSGFTTKDHDIKGTTDHREKLDPRYRKRSDPANFFCRGRVFALLWHENAGNRQLPEKDVQRREDELGDLFARSEGRQKQTLFTRGPFDEYIYSHIRRMVVVQKFHGYSWCIPINTYGGKGAAKDGMSEREIQAHAVIYDSKSRNPPQKENRMIKEAIAVDLVQGEKLDAKSRINYSKINTVEHTVKVLEIGMISKDCMGRFQGQWRVETDPAIKSYKSEHPNTLRRRSLTVSHDQRHGLSSSAGERRPSIAERSASRHQNVQSSTGSSTRPQAETPRTGDRGSRQQPQSGPRPQDWRGPGRGRHSS